MSLLSLLAVAICTKPELSPRGVKGTATLGGAGGKARGRQAAPVETALEGHVGCRAWGPVGGGRSRCVPCDQKAGLLAIKKQNSTHAFCCYLNTWFPPHPVVLKRERASESSRRFVTTQLPGPHQGSFCFSRSGVRDQGLTSGLPKTRGY